MSSSRSRHWLTSCNPLYACLCEARPGCHLTTLFGSTTVMPITVQNAVPKKKRTLVPLLTVVFLFSYGLMTMLIVEQGSVIQSQRNLIKILMTDSTELWSMKGKAVADQQTARTKISGPRAGALGSNSVDPDSVDPDSVSPGSGYPGNTAAPFPRPYRKDREGPAPASARTRCGFDRSASRFAIRFSAQVGCKRPGRFWKIRHR